MPVYTGASHSMELPFVFYNLNGDGYRTNLLASDTPAYIDVAKTVSAAWISFIADPNGGPGAGLALPGGETWPMYNAKDGAIGENLVFALNGSYVEKDDWRREGMAWYAEHSLDLFGN